MSREIWKPKWLRDPPASTCVSWMSLASLCSHCVSTSSTWFVIIFNFFQFWNGLALDGGSFWFGSETTTLEQILMRNQCFWQWNLTARLNFNESTEIKILNPTKNHVFESLTLTQFHKFVAKAKFWYRYRIDLIELVLMTSQSTPNSSTSISNRPFTNFDLPPMLIKFWLPSTRPFSILKHFVSEMCLESYCSFHRFHYQNKM